MFRFWYRFVPQNVSQIHSGAGEKVYDNIEQYIPHYMGEVFEEICKQYMWKENLAERLPFYFRDAGRWWGVNPIKKSEQEIDIIACSETQAIFCECKWSNQFVGNDVLDGLIEKSLMFNYKEKYYYLFSKTGYTTECIKNAVKNVKLIAFNEFFED